MQTGTNAQQKKKTETINTIDDNDDGTTNSNQNMISILNPAGIIQRAVLSH